MTDRQLLTEDDDLDADGKPGQGQEYVAIETAPDGREDPGADPRSDEDEEHPDPDATDDERAELRERRRREKAERKERRDHAIKRDKLELDFLRQRNDELERRLTAQEQRSLRQDFDSIDQRLRETQNEIHLAEQVIAKAIAAGNGDDVTKAMRIRDEAMARANQITGYKHQQQQAARKAPADGGMDPRVQRLATDFIKENPWYDPSGRDEDSAIVLAIDGALVRDGYDPTSPDYWDELRNRASRRLPDKFGKQADAPRREARGGPRVGGGKEHVPTSSRKEVYISPERKQALIDAGVWDDPQLRQRYIKRYAEYDRNGRA